MYKLSQELLTKYAQVMVRYALNKGEGIKPGETVWLMGQECTKDLFMEMCREIWRAGGNVLVRYLPDEFQRYSLNRDLLEIGTDEQLSFFAKEYWQGITDSADHLLFIMAQPNVHAFEGISSDRLDKLSKATAPFMEMRTAKERENKLFWTVCLYGTESAAQEAELTLEAYWEQIIAACYLRKDDPVRTWKEIQARIETIRDKLNALQIEKLHIVGTGDDEIDLHILVGENRKFLGGGGHNIPSFEIFTSPDWRGTHGKIAFNQPLYYQGKRISGISLAFENGIVTKIAASENQDALVQMISNNNADKVGEFSLTEAGLSPINKFMAHTLFDENRGGEFGNTHIALGNSYRDAFDGDIAAPNEEDWNAMGFNHCPSVHTDIISTSNRIVYATLPGGKEIVVYENGKFQI